MSIHVICDAGIVDDNPESFVCGFGWIIVSGYKVFLRRKAKTFYNKLAYHTDLIEFCGIINSVTDAYLHFNPKNQNIQVYCDNMATNECFENPSKKNWKKSFNKPISRFISKEEVMNFKSLVKMTTVRHVNSGGDMVIQLHKISHRLARIAINDEIKSYLIDGDDEEKKYFGKFIGLKEVIDIFNDNYWPYKIL